MIDALAVVAALLSLGPVDPPNLAEIDCVAAKLAVDLAARSFPNDVPGVRASVARAARLSEVCEDSPPPGPAQVPSGGYPKALTPRPKEHRLYVSPRGSDSNVGTLQLPFRTIDRARRAVRALGPLASRPPVTILLRAGTYYQDATIEFGAGDGGASPESAVIFAAYPGEEVTLSGGVGLRGLDWKPLPVSVGSAFSALLPPDAPVDFTTLFVDGNRAIRARFPNGNPKDNSNLCFSKVDVPGEEFRHAGHLVSGISTASTSTAGAKHIIAKPNNLRYGDYPNFDVMAAGYADLFTAPGGMCLPGNVSSSPTCSPTSPCTVPCNSSGSLRWFAHYGRAEDRTKGITSAFSFDKATWTSRTWSHPERAGVVRGIAPIGWGSMTFPLAGVDVDKGEIKLGRGGFQLADWEDFHGTPFYIEGIREELDSPLEWFVDPTDRILYYFPNQTMPSPPPPPPPSPPPPPPPPPPGSVMVIATSNTSKCSNDGRDIPCCLDLQFWRTTPGSRYAADDCHHAPANGWSERFPTSASGPPGARDAFDNPHGPNQLFTFTGLRGGRDDGVGLLKAVIGPNLCLTGTQAGGVVADTCSTNGPPAPSQMWSLDGGVLKSQEGLCLAAVLRDGGALSMVRCDPSSPAQQWKLEKPGPNPPATRQDDNIPRERFRSHETAPKASTWLNATVPPPTLIEPALLTRIVSFVGTENIEFRGVRFTHSATTQLEPYEVPSGGDWSVHRGGAVFIEDSSSIVIADSVFDSVGGNAIFVSKRVVNSSITGNRFAYPGDSGVALAGISNLVDGTAPTYPEHNVIKNNW